MYLCVWNSVNTVNSKISKTLLLLLARGARREAKKNSSTGNKYAKKKKKKTTPYTLENNNYSRVYSIHGGDDSLGFFFIIIFFQMSSSLLGRSEYTERRHSFAEMSRERVFRIRYYCDAYYCRSRRPANTYIIDVRENFSIFSLFLSGGGKKKTKCYTRWMCYISGGVGGGRYSERSAGRIIFYFLYNILSYTSIIILSLTTYRLL